MDLEEFESKKIKARALYDKQTPIYNPYMKCEVSFTAEGFHHLQFSAGRERPILEQLLKFSLLPTAIDIIKRSTTLQEFRKDLLPVGKKKADGSITLKITYFWAFIALVGETKIRTKTILKKTGDGKVIFWSVMKDS